MAHSLKYNAFAPLRFINWNEMKQHFTYDEYRTFSTAFPQGPKGMTKFNASLFVEKLRESTLRRLLKWRNIHIERVMSSLYPTETVRCKEVEDKLNQWESIKIANGVPSADGWIDSVPTGRGARWLNNRPKAYEATSNVPAPFSSGSDSDSSHSGLTAGQIRERARRVERQALELSHDRRITQTSAIQQTLEGLSAPEPIDEAQQIETLKKQVEALKKELTESKSLNVEAGKLILNKKAEITTLNKDLKTAKTAINNLEKVYAWDIETHHRGASKLNFLKYTKGHISLELYVKCGGLASEY
jgi:hypothetical protein